jgi:hypothetical protein
MKEADAFARLLDETARSMRAALEAQSPEELARMRGEMLKLANAARVVQESMSALAQQSTGMWEEQLRAAQQAIEQALAGRR